jgi:uncharacterized protein YaaQ
VVDGGESVNSDRATAIDTLLVAIVQQQDGCNLVAELVERGYSATRVNAQGGFLQAGNVIVLIGTEAAREAGVFEAISRTCRARTTWTPGVPVGDPLSGIGWPAEVPIGGAVVFALPVERCVNLSDDPETSLAASSSGHRR